MGDSTTGGTAPSEGPCDIYEADGVSCVAAYSTVRRLYSSYTGPLYQVRTGSNAMNTGSGGETHDIGQTAEGFADAAAQDALCSGTICSVSRLYDQSGRGNDLTVAKRFIEFPALVRAQPYRAPDAGCCQSRRPVPAQRELRPAQPGDALLRRPRFVSHTVLVFEETHAGIGADR
jgi:hypothetical protein